MKLFKNFWKKNLENSQTIYGTILKRTDPIVPTIKGEFAHSKYTQGFAPLMKISEKSTKSK